MTTTDQSRQLIMEYLHATGRDKSSHALDRYVADPHLREFMLSLERGLPGYHLIPQHIVASRYKVAVRFLLRGRHLGELFGMAPSGKQIQIAGVFLYELQNGRIIRHWLQLDTGAFKQQTTATEGVPAKEGTACVYTGSTG